MSLHWYACISTNTCCFEMHHISLEMDWYALSNASLIVWIRSAVHEILADKAFTATDVLISQLFVVAFVPPTYVRIALIWGFPAQLSLWKSVHWLWRYKLNEVCNIGIMVGVLVLVWDTHHCLRAMHLAHARDQLWKRKLIISITKNTYLEGYTRQDCLVLIHLSQGLTFPILTAASLQYFPSCFPLAFLEGYCPFLSPVAISLCLCPKEKKKKTKFL